MPSLDGVAQASKAQHTTQPAQRKQRAFSCPDNGGSTSQKSPLRSQGLALLAAGQTWKQVAEALNVAGGTVRSWKAQAQREATLAQHAGTHAAATALAGAGSGQQASAGPTPTSDDPARLARLRKKALIVLARAQAGSAVSQAQRDAASKILAATKPRASESQAPADEASVYRSMHEAQLLEMWLVSGCTVYGIARVRARLAELEAAGMLDAGGPAYPMPPLLGGEPNQ